MIWLLLFACRSNLVSPAAVPTEDPSEAWGETLAAVVTDDGLVDYDALEARRDTLDAYVAWLSTPEAFPGKKTTDHHATYLNAYNALVLFQVLERDRPASVLDVPGWVPKPGSGFFVETAFPVGRDTLSLSEIEHERVRQRELDFRDHAALNCASMGCPPMLPDIYRRRTLNRQLDDQMRRWVNDPARGVTVDADGTLVLSAIFQWFHRDFTFWTGHDNVCAPLIRYAEPPLKGKLVQAAAQGCPHRTRDYDWSLNHAPGGAPATPRSRAILPDDAPTEPADEDF